MTAEFGVAQTGLDAAKMACDRYKDALEAFAACPKKSPDRSGRALEIQSRRRDMNEAVTANRRRLKLIPGDMA